MPGILYNGQLYSVPDLTILSPGDEPFVKMSSGDCAPRDTPWIRQITIHTTKGIWPQLIRPGAGPSGHAQEVANYWALSPEHGGAPFVIGSNGTILCLVDIGRFLTYHATTVNAWSVGIEMYQEADGSIYQAVFDACVKLVVFLCDLLGIPFQGDNRVYHENGILQRMLHGGPDVVGVYGHRDNAWQFPEWMTPEQRVKYPNGTSSRGRGDPGDEIWTRLDTAGRLKFSIDKFEEKAFWKIIQGQLGFRGTLQDGVCGPKTVNALRSEGLWAKGLPVYSELTRPAYRMFPTSIHGV